jgi:hypothetical protein
LPLPARACTTATAQQNRVSAASGHDGSRRMGDQGQRPNLLPAGASAEAHGHPMGVEARAHARRSHGHGGGRDSDDDTAARTAIAQGKQRTRERAGLHVRRRRRQHPQEFSQPGSMAGITSGVRGAVAVKVTLLPTRWPGQLEGSRGLSSPRWPRAEGQASVKRRSTQRRGRQ